MEEAANVDVPAVTKAPKGKTGLTIDVFDITGKVIESIALPEAVFGGTVNKKLIAQAVRVYLANQRQGNASTKTRGEVDGSTRKIYRQKGTGRARHGGVRAPLFVKGGIAHGPHPKDHRLVMPKKMKQAAFASALAARLQDEAITVVSGFEGLEAKTKAFSAVFTKLGFVAKKRSALFVLPKDLEKVFKSARNLAGIDVTTAERLNTYELLAHKNIIFMKDAIATFVKEHTV